MNRYMILQMISLYGIPVSVWNNTTLVEKMGSLETSIFPNDSAREAVFTQKQKTYPVILSYQNIIYALLWNDENSTTIVCGPVTMTGEHRANDFYIAECSEEKFVSFLMILWNDLTGEELSRQEILDRNLKEEPSLFSLRKETAKVVRERMEEGKLHNPYSQELREQQSIQDGDLEGLKRSLEETFEGEFGTLASHPVRQMKNLAIVVISLACRSAIRGGMVPEQAFSMSDAFIQKIENTLNDPVAIEAAARKAEFEFAKQVRDIKRKGDGNPLVYRTKAYISERIQERLKVSDIAEALGVNADYLSHVFHNSQDQTISRYIQAEKVRLSKDYLRYSEYTVQEISSWFNFSSQSHYTQVFQKLMGMTPKEYRKKNQIV